MNPIEYFGDLLSKKIGKGDLVGRGLLLYSVQDEVGSADIITLDILKRTFQNSLKIRLKKVNASDVNKISDEMVKELLLKQSLLTIGAV